MQAANRRHGSSNGKQSVQLLSGVSYEALENRRLLAGDVSVFLAANNILQLQGDSASNQVEIRGTDSGAIVVEGLNGTRINGQSRVRFADLGSGLNGLRVRLEGGDDLVRVEDLRVRQSVTVHGGSGNDAIGFDDVRVGLDLTVLGEAGDDAIALDDVIVNHNLTVIGDQGNDLIGFDGVNIRGATTVRGGLGNDRLAIDESLHRGAVTITGDEGDDFIGLDQSRIRGTTNIDLGGGNDALYLDDTVVSGNATVQGGAGTDRVELDGVSRLTRRASITGFESLDVPGGEWLTEAVFEDLLARGALRDS